MNHKIIHSFLVFFVVCASFAQQTDTLPVKEVSHSFYATGNLAIHPENAKNTTVLDAIKNAMSR